jgi:UDP-N-acetylmuramate dehydrogenase
MSDPAPHPSPCPGGADPSAVDRALAALEPLGDQVFAGGAVGPMTTYRVGGAAAVLVSANSYQDLAVVADAVAAGDLSVLVVGRGSNLLVAQAGFGGIAVVLEGAGFGSITAEDLVVRAGGAVALPALARQTVDLGLTGLEWGVGVPGSVGGAVRMNAGGHGGDIARSLVSCQMVDLTRPGAPVRTLQIAELDYSYRHSAIGPGQIVTEAVFRLAAGPAEAGRRTIRQIVRWRREHQPGGQNAGSVFTNPADDSAGRLIDAAGLKGRRWRTAMVSPKHANFIQADPGGSSDDVKELIEQVQAEVERFHGIRLRPEVRMVGFYPQPQSQVESSGVDSG